MTNVVHFSRVEIIGGFVKETWKAIAAGRPPYRYFVDLVEPCGGRIGFWDGNSHDDALLAARELSDDFRVPSVDLTARARK